MEYRDGSPAEDDPGWLERRIARAVAAARAEFENCAFPVFRAVAPPLDEGALAAWDRVNGEVVKVELRHGAGVSFAGPWLRVSTELDGPHLSRYSLAGVIEDERDWLSSQGLVLDEPPVAAVGSAAGEGGAVAGGAAAADVGAGADADDPALEVYELPLMVGGQEEMAAFRQEGPFWAARLQPACARVVITVVACGVPSEGLELTPVEDLDVCLAGRERLMRVLGERRDARRRGNGSVFPASDAGFIGGPVSEAAPGAGGETGAETGAEPPLGLEAHRRLVDRSVSEAQEIEVALREHRPARRRGPGRADLWEPAVRQQMRLAGDDHDEARDAVTSLVNHMIQLAAATDWFVSSPDGEAAREESIRFTAFDSEVDSVAAQRAWQQEWRSRHDRSADSPQARRAWLDELVAAREVWLELWERWRVQRTG